MLRSAFNAAITPFNSNNSFSTSFGVLTYHNWQEAWKAIGSTVLFISSCADLPVASASVKAMLTLKVCSACAVTLDACAICSCTATAGFMRTCSCTLSGLRNLLLHSCCMRNRTNFLSDTIICHGAKFLIHVASDPHLFTQAKVGLADSKDSHSFGGRQS